jgi:CRP-like cAMP-binding protein
LSIADSLLLGPCSFRPAAGVGDPGHEAGSLVASAGVDGGPGLSDPGIRSPLRVGWKVMVGDRDEELAARLGRCAVLVPLGESERRALARAAARTRLRPGDLVMRAGEAADFAVMVLAGRLDVRRDTEAGEAMVLRSVRPGEILGLSTAAGAPATADVVAGEATEALVIPGRALRSVLAGEPAAALRVIAHMADLLGRLTDEMEELRSLDVEERLRRVLRREGAGLREVRLTHEALAARVGATRANVSRALRRLEALGAIRRRRGLIELRDLEARRA